MSTPNCRTCGACCVEQVILLGAGDKVPILMSDGLFMNKQGGRCIALTGRVGIDPLCSIYPNRPKICRVFLAGSRQCLEVRGSCGLGASGGDRTLTS